MNDSREAAKARRKLKFARCLTVFPLVHSGEWNPRMAPIHTDWFLVDRCRNLRASWNLRMRCFGKRSRCWG